VEKEKLPKTVEEQKVVYYQEDEIDLYELFLTLKKRWKVITVITFTTVVLALVYILIKTPIYKSEVYISNIYTGGKPAKSILDIVSELNAKKIINSKKAYVKEIVIHKIGRASEKDLPNTIKITLMGVDNTSINKLSDEILSYLQNKYSILLKKYQESTLKKIAEIENQIISLEKYTIPQLQDQKSFLLNEEIPALKKKLEFYQDKIKKIDELIKEYNLSIRNYEETVKNISKSLNIQEMSKSAILILSNQLVQYENLILFLRQKIKEKEVEKNKIENEIIPNIEKSIKEIKIIKIAQINEKLKKASQKITIMKKDIENLKLSLKPPLTQNFEKINQIIEDSPYKPKKALVLAVSTVSGIFLGIFMAFFLEWLETARKRRNSDTEQLNTL